jgi:peptidoglycan hydrolase-like protein with peptidoglycan-binding domain
MYSSNKFIKNSVKTLQQIELSNIVTVPTTITVHLGNPDDVAENATVSFLDYIKNVGSSELYPTWPENALRANLLAITSIALNRVFTEWYRLRGYDFDITNSTQFDQAFVFNRGIFDSISVIADEVFNDYIVREGQFQPLFATFCDGRISQCNGLSQWGTVELANQGYTPIEILRYYFGEDINIVFDAPIRDVQASFPGELLQIGDSSYDVLSMQLALDRIRINYPAIPLIEPLNGYFNESTEAAVRAFQSIFKLPVTGVVDEATWYMIRYIFIAVTKLAELTTQGYELGQLLEITRETYLEGDVRPTVELIQYALNVLATFNPAIPMIAITGYFDDQTRNAVIEFQRITNLEPTGVVDRETYEALATNMFNILDTLPSESVYLPNLRWPGEAYTIGADAPPVYLLQEMLSYISLIIPMIPTIEPTGVYDVTTQQAVREFQRLQGLDPTGMTDEQTWDSIVDIYRQQRYGSVSGITPII